MCRNVAHSAVICCRQAGNFVMQLKLDAAAAEAEGFTASADADAKTAPAGDASPNRVAPASANGTQAVADAPTAVEPSEQKTVEDAQNKDDGPSSPEASAQAGNEPLKG